jgi:hypothetical protein
MKATLEFNIPEEQEELQAALKGGLYKARIEELYQEIFRPHIKYGKPILPKDEISMQEITEEQLAVIEQIWKNIGNYLEDVL